MQSKQPNSGFLMPYDFTSCSSNLELFLRQLKTFRADLVFKELIASKQMPSGGVVGSFLNRHAMCHEFAARISRTKKRWLHFLCHGCAETK